MALLWTVPRDWQTKEPITKTKLNTLSDQLKYLYNPSRVMVTNRGGGTTIVVTSTTMVNLDYTQYAASIELTGTRDLTVKLCGAILGAAAGMLTYIDVLLDNNIYLSSMTSSPLALGMQFYHHTVASHYLNVEFSTVVPKGLITPGVHIFNPTIRVSSSQVSWLEPSQFSQFFVGEIS